MASKIVLFFLLISHVFFVEVVDAAVSKEDCQSLDYSSKFPPIRQQGHSGQCYAFTAADLIGVAQGFPPEKAVSAFDVAVSYLEISPSEIARQIHQVKDWESSKEMSLYDLNADIQIRKKTRLSGIQSQIIDGGGFGSLATLAYQANGRGACLESQLKSEGSLVDNGVNYYLGERTLALMGQNTKTVKLGGKRDRDKYERKWMPLPKAPSEEAYMQLCAPKGYDMFNGAAAWVDQLNNESLKELRKNIDGLCSARVPMKPMEIEQWSLTSVPRMHEISNKLASFLKAGNPVSIGYSTTFLEKGRAAQPSFDNLHESSIVGMRWNDNTQTCEFKLRNSWGKSCALYAPEFQRVCEDGYLWINDRDVQSNVNALTVIKLKK